MSIQTVDSLNIGRYTAQAAAKSAVGCGSPVFTKRTTAPAVFLCAAHSYTSQWWGVQGSRKAGRVLFVTGTSTPVRLTTNKCGSFGGEFFNTHEEAATMATTPTQTHRKSAREGQSLLTHADNLNIQLDTMHYLSTQSSVDARVQLVRMLLVARKQGQQLREALFRKGDVEQ